MAKKNASSGSGNGESKSRKPKGAELSWSDADGARDTALIGAIAAGHTSTSDIASVLASDPSFAGVPADAITAGKIRLRLANLRKAGVAVPKFGRSKGYKPNVDVLNALLGVATSGEQPA